MKKKDEYDSKITTDEFTDFACGMAVVEAASAIIAFILILVLPQHKKERKNMKQYRIYVQSDDVRATFYIKANSKKKAMEILRDEFPISSCCKVCRLVETVEYPINSEVK